jgi:putative flavoprotein involved in K+ transport
VTSADVDVLVVGAGHAGLGVAARLKARGREPAIFEANARVGDSWRARWASLRLFTPRFVNGLPGMRFPDGDDPFPNKDEVADYQQRYAEALGVPIRLGTRITHLRRASGGFVASLDGGAITARNVVIANGAHRTPKVPAFASRLDPAVLQLHSSEYGRAGALPPGPVLVVGGRNSGAEIAMELAGTHDVALTFDSGTSYAPARWRSTGWWRTAQFRSWALRGAIVPGPLPWPLKPPAGKWVEVDVRRAEREGVLRLVPRAVDATPEGVRLLGGRTERFPIVIWATGFRVDDSWIDVPQGADGIRVRRHRRGPVPGLWIVRANLLASLHWGALDAAADIARRTSVP